MINKKRLSNRIKKHEGYSRRAYLDQLGNLTIGYGHLIRNKEEFETGKKYSKKLLNKLFNKDLYITITNYNKVFSKNELPSKVEEVIIEMFFQLGLNKFLKFRKMIKALKNKNFLKASEEMRRSKWNKQDPKRVDTLAKIMKKQTP